MSALVAVDLSGHIGQMPGGCHVALLADPSVRTGFERDRLHGLPRDLPHSGASVQG